MLQDTITAVRINLQSGVPLSRPRGAKAISSPRWRFGSKASSIWSREAPGLRRSIRAIRLFDVATDAIAFVMARLALRVLAIIFARIGDSLFFARFMCPLSSLGESTGHSNPRRMYRCRSIWSALAIGSAGSWWALSLPHRTTPNQSRKSATRNKNQTTTLTPR